MTCREARKSLVDLCDAGPHAAEEEIRAHLAACAQCAREYAEIQAAMAAIEPPVRVQASPDFKERVMNETAKVGAPASGRRYLIPRMALAGAVVLAVVLLAPWIASLTGKQGRTPAMALLAQSAEALSGLQSVHIFARMRTIPHDNFDHVDPACDWVPLEIWKQFSDPPKWRVEKSGRVVVMDGTASLLWIRPDFAARGGPRPGFLGWVNLLLDTPRLMENELAAARAQGAAVSLAPAANGARELVLSIRRKPGGGNDWLQGKTVSSSDHTRVYRFDADSKRLVGMQLVRHAASGDVPVFEVTRVVYNEPLDPALFTLQLPKGVAWAVAPEHMPTANRPLPPGPKEAATVFFEALSREDWEQALVVYPQTSFSERFKTGLGGLQVLSIGEPFQSRFYRGWFVPYEIRLKSGEVKKWNLAVRNDNPAKRWVFDGGL